MMREEQVQRALKISQEMRERAAEEERNRRGSSKRLLAWKQIDARPILAALVGSSKKQADDDAPPERED